MGLPAEAWKRLKALRPSLPRWLGPLRRQTCEVCGSGLRWDTNNPNQRRRFCSRRCRRARHNRKHLFAA